MGQNTGKSTWEINRVSTPERIFQKILTEVKRPLGILVFGSGSGFEDGIIQQIINETKALRLGVDRLGTYHDSIYQRTFAGGRNVLVVFNGRASANHDERHQHVQALRETGAGSVIGFYVESEYIYSTPDSYKTYCDIKANPPTPDGLDYLIHVHEEGA